MDSVTSRGDELITRVAARLAGAHRPSRIWGRALGKAGALRWTERQRKSDSEYGTPIR